MSENDKTRFVVNPNEAKTRLVRASQQEGEKVEEAKIRFPKISSQNQIEEIPKTRLAGRSSLPNSSITLNDDNNEPIRPIAGWLVVIKGPGQGQFAPIFDGMNSVGRGDNQSTRVDFGDETISREQHAFLTYDLKSRTFYLSHGGKSNIIRCNGSPVLQALELKHGDIISIGNSEFAFSAFCGPNFDWVDVK